jgi:hypothetical protein
LRVRKAAGFKGLITLLSAEGGRKSTMAGGGREINIIVA